MVGPGWHEMIRKLYKAKPSWTGWIVVIQVKEKFGGLRFYVDGAPDWYYDLIDYYEAKSLTICESCGKPGKPRDDAWIKTMCDDCAAKNDK